MSARTLFKDELKRKRKGYKNIFQRIRDLAKRFLASDSEPPAEMQLKYSTALAEWA